MLFSLNHKNVFTAGHLVCVTDTSIPGARLTKIHTKDHYGGNSEVFSHINKDILILLT